MSQEMKDVEQENQRLVDDIAHYQTKARNQASDIEDVKRSDEELRDVVELSRRWSEDAGRIAVKRMQIAQKKIDLSATVADPDRDLKTVERDLNRMMEEKDDWANKIVNLNREASQFNTEISRLAEQATRMDQVARKKEEQFAAERKNADRKAEVSEQLQDIGMKEKQLNDQIAPISKKISTKLTERDRARNLASDEESGLMNDLSKFKADAEALRAVCRDIEKFEEANSSREQDSFESKVASVREEIAERQQDVDKLKPKVEEVKRAVHDQERHRKQLQQNVEILESGKVVSELTKEIEELRERKGEIEEADDAFDLFTEAKKRNGEQQERKYRTEGRFSEVVEQIRSLKRKLKAPEYRNVEEEYRVEMIKHQTTVMAASDLKKYATAIDKALLQFHSLKIREINKIIRELWLMTYKGLDITNIELVSGAEPGSRAAKSYNYRVVMTKGTSRLDMRGRCSAGQRVLASIVIRLALAETFGVNCGCIALDEPTVNLDEKNKKGLATSLAQIVASRAQQRNFQLIMITHDEDFVGMMKTELSSLTGFSMPEKYFQVRREQGLDGMYYSKIDAIDWDELV